MKLAAFIMSVLVLVLAAAGGGYLLGTARVGPGERELVDGVERQGGGSAPAAKQVYTCSMHPQVRLDRPGDCPICEMPLIPADSATTAAGETPTLQLSAHAIAMASVETVAVDRRRLSRDLRAVGRIEYNESSLATITARVDGFAERLFVNFTGVEIRAGDHLAEVYSPELLVAQQELLIALQAGAGGSLADVAKTKLRLLGLTEQQVTNLVENKQTTDRVTLYSPINGTVIEKSIVDKASFDAGDALYRIANLDSVWIYLDIYEYDLPWVRYGQQVRISAEAIPGRTFEGVVTFVQPIVNDQTRTVRVPVYVDNEDHALKPGMFVTALISAELTGDGRAAPTGVEGRFSCPMHPQVLADEAGPCPICEMPLEMIPNGANEPSSPGQRESDDGIVAESPAFAGMKYSCPMECEGDKTYDQPGRCPVCNMRLAEVPAGAKTIEGADALAVPVSAVLDSGTRQIVYIEKSSGLFEPREVTLGPRAGEYFVVLTGLSGGERVVTRGNFLIDSQFQVTGHPSLFYPGGLHAAMGHDHEAVTAGDAPHPDAPKSDMAPTGQQEPDEHRH